MSIDKKIEALEDRLNSILQQQKEFTQELINIQNELIQLKGSKTESEDAVLSKKEAEKTTEVLLEKIDKIGDRKIPGARTKVKERLIGSSRGKTNFEKFIGENLINKIGILVLIIGVAYGAKLAIDNDWINPTMRIFLGYLSGLILCILAIRLKNNYKHFSAVLLSGSMAIMYFISFFAHSFYDLIPLLPTFGLMVFFTIFTCAAAIKYDESVIAHLGLVGAYAVPFLLSNEEGSATVLFSYIAIINIGILILAFFRDWKSLHFASFFWTWMIFGQWLIEYYEQSESLSTGLIFSSLFFLSFYISFVAYKWYNRTRFKILDLIMLIGNSLIYYGVGYLFVYDLDATGRYLGLYTLLNAVIHFIFSLLFYYRKLADRSSFYFVAALCLSFLALAVPVQLDGYWVTICWSVLSFVLFYIGRTKAIQLFEYLSYPIVLIAFISLLDDWNGYQYSAYSESILSLSLLSNPIFLGSCLFILLSGLTLYTHISKVGTDTSGFQNRLRQIFSFALPVFFLASLYGAFSHEIGLYWDKLRYVENQKLLQANEYSSLQGFISFKYVWQLIYTMAFLSILSMINLRRIKNKILGIINMVLIVGCIIAFLALGLWELKELSEVFKNDEITSRGILDIAIRYIALPVFLFVLFCLDTYRRLPFVPSLVSTILEIIIHFSMLVYLSSELIYWMSFAEYGQSTKLSISILWGAYALLMVILGIWKKKKYLRISAIVLFALTLLKLFLFDISHLAAIPKIIVFISLGILLLIISFIYNKYKHLIDEN